MKKFDVTYSHEMVGKNSFGEKEMLRMGETQTVSAESIEQVIADFKTKHNDKTNLKISVVQH